MTFPTDPFIDSAKSFLSACLEGKHSSREQLYPWRKPGEFSYLHSLRVESIARKLLAGQADSFSPAEIQALRLAAILHDAGRLDDTPDHAVRGVEIVSAWLRREEIAPQVTLPELVLSLIAHHSQKDIPAPGPVHAILNDADLLDEIGVMSIFMSANRVDRASAHFFHDLLTRVREFELPFCDRVLERLNTQAGRDYIMKKKRFIEAFVAQLEDELA